MLNAKNIRASILKDSEGCMDISEISEVKELLYGANEHQKAGIAKMSDLLEAQMLYQQSLDRRTDAYANMQLRLLEYKQATGQK